MCRQDNAILFYRENRVEILEDKKAYAEEKEPFHIKMLREEKEEAAR